MFQTLRFRWSHPALAYRAPPSTIISKIRKISYSKAISARASRWRRNLPRRRRLAAGGDATVKLLRFVDSLLADDAPELAAISDLAYLAPERRAVISSRFQAVKAGIAALLAAGAARGELRECRASIIAPAILGLVLWVPIARQWRSNESLSHRDLVEALKAILREGVATDRRSTVEFRPIDIALGGSVAKIGGSQR